MCGRASQREHTLLNPTLKESLTSLVIGVSCNSGHTERESGHQGRYCGGREKKCRTAARRLPDTGPTPARRGNAVASRPGLLPPQSITIYTRMLRTLITRGCFFGGRRPGLEARNAAHRRYVGPTSPSVRLRPDAGATPARSRRASDGTLEPPLTRRRPDTVMTLAGR